MAPPRKPLTLRSNELPSIPNENEIQAKIRGLQKKLGFKPKKRVMPKASDEAGPGKPTTLA